MSDRSEEFVVQDIDGRLIGIGGIRDNDVFFRGVLDSGSRAVIVRRTWIVETVYPISRSALPLGSSPSAAPGRVPSGLGNPRRRLLERTNDESR